MRSLMICLLCLALACTSVFAHEGHEAKADAKGKSEFMTVPATGNAKQVGTISVKALPAMTYAKVDVAAATFAPEGGYAAGNEGYDQAFQAMMTKGFGSLMMWVNAGNVPSGAAFAIYHNDPTETAAKDLKCTVAFPAGKEAKESAEVKIAEMPAHDAAVVQYSGDYAEAGPIWNSFEKWITDNGYQPAGAPLEVYLKGPHETQKPEEYLTEIRWPVQKQAK